MGSLIFFALVAICFLIFGILILATSRLEKNDVRTFVPAETNRPDETSPYFLAMNQAAADMGCRFGGYFVQKRQKLGSRVCISLWVSPENHTLILIGGGKVARVSYDKTFLRSTIESGRTLETSDSFGLVDPSDITSKEVLLNAGLPELYAKHQERLAARQEGARSFDETRTFEEFEAMETAKVERMREKGLVEYVDPAHSIWRFTWKGSMRNVLSLVAQAKQGQKQKDRVKLKRPGSA